MSQKDTIEARVKAFAAELEDLIRAAALDAARAALAPRSSAGGAKAAAAPKAAKAAKAAKAPKAEKAAKRPAKRKKGQKRSKEEIAQVEAALEAYIKANEGKRIEEISKDLTITTNDLSRPMKKLIAQGKVRFTGTRRATRYFVGKKK